MGETGFDFETARRVMAEKQVRTWDVLSQRVLETMENMPREHFVPDRYRKLAYADMQIPIGHGQVMLNPKIEGRILQALHPERHESVLDIGTGTGYLSACLARMARSVLSVDIIPEFRQPAQERIKALGIDNVECDTADASHGLDRKDQFHTVVVEAGLPKLREDFHRHVREGGRLLLIVGTHPIMEGWLFTRVSDQGWTSESLFDTLIPNIIDPSERPEFDF